MDYQELQESLVREPKTWLITGVAGFIGSNLLETLLKLDQRVVGMDNFVTGRRENLEEVRWSVSTQTWRNFTFMRGSICELRLCRKAVKGVDYVLHQAALGSVPRSLKTPLATNEVNVNGFLNMLLASRDERVEKFVYAASSSTYGDHEQLPKVEDTIGRPLSPYAVSKLVNELYADVFARNYRMQAVGLRYFNVFGPRQDPEGPYAAVIPRWAHAIINGDDVCIYGDGETSRDFCFVDNAVQANLLAACVDNGSPSEVYNVAVGERTSLNDLFGMLKDALSTRGIRYGKRPVYTDFRPGDVRHSLADIGKIQGQLGYQPSHRVRDGIENAVDWYLKSAPHQQQNAAG